MAQISLSGSIGVPGSVAVLGNFNVVFASNGPHTMTAAEYSNNFLDVTSGVSLTATQNLVAPLNQGQSFVVQNNTTGGHSIQVIGATGTGVTIPSGTTASVVCDGTNYFTVSGGAIALGGDLSGTTSAAVVVQAQSGNIIFNATSIEFAVSVAGPSLFQATSSTGAGANLTVQAQGSTASLANGGNLILTSGSSATGTVGNVQLAVGGTVGLILKPTGIVTIENLTTGVLHADASGNLTSSPVINADISNAAAIAVNKLAAGTAAQLLLNNSSAIPTWTTVSGDVALTAAGLTTVAALQGNAVQAGTLTSAQDGYVLTWTGTEWSAEAITDGSVTLMGDVTGSANANSVVGLYNHAIASTVPVASAVPVWNSSLSRYDIRQLTAADLGAAFGVSLSGGSTVEIGTTVTNPTFTASYTTTPNAATLTNTDGLDSPLTLSSPYTSATVVGSFHHTTATSVTFTINATNASGSNASSNSFITYEARAFVGVGASLSFTAGSPTPTVTGGNNALLSTGDTLNNVGLFNSVVGQTFTVVPSGQKVYFLLVGSSHTFTTNGGAFPFAMGPGGNGVASACGFVNFQGATVSMYLYESTNTLSASYTITIAS